MKQPHLMKNSQNRLALTCVAFLVLMGGCLALTSCAKYPGSVTVKNKHGQFHYQSPDPKEGPAPTP